MFSTKAVRSVGLGLAASTLGLLFACSPADTDDVDVDTGSTLNPTCAPGYIEDPKDPKNCIPDPKGDQTPARFSYCAGVNPYAWHNTKGLPGNARLAPIVNGYVPCVSLEDPQAKPTTCKLPSSAVALDAKQGSFAQVGQEIPVKAADGSVSVFVVASKVTATQLRDGSVRYTVPCTAPAGADVAGTAAGEELAGACIVEAMGYADNAAHHEHDNYASLQVCAIGTNADADEAAVAKSLTVFCYKGEGAALNDVNGTERDMNNVYLVGSDRCHVGWNSGYEVPAAKRPATSGYPVKVNEKSPIVWRAVASGVAIANP
ncbi:MAG TPA: hypothetical protein VM925_14925 [Labilithrix sp.]|nr:hypothetical protein [Labilithrix sp.]